jgi:hypothetical protein
MMKPLALYCSPVPLSRPSLYSAGGDLGSGAAASAPLLDLGDRNPLTVRSFDSENYVEQIACAVKSRFSGLKCLIARPIRSFESPHLP